MLKYYIWPSFYYILSFQIQKMTMFKSDMLKMFTEFFKFSNVFLYSQKNYSGNRLTCQIKYRISSIRYWKITYVKIDLSHIPYKKCSLDKVKNTPLWSLYILRFVQNIIIIFIYRENNNRGSIGWRSHGALNRQFWYAHVSRNLDHTYN